MGEPPAYPMTYGYSLVGTVVGVGPNVPLSLVGQTAFAFSPHAAAAFVDVSCVIRVPPDLATSPSDAAFLPAAGLINTTVLLYYYAAVRLYY
jgi:NADPH:quinone reductase-like Zn-dependent oxidoreductase